MCEINYSNGLLKILDILYSTPRDFSLEIPLAGLVLEIEWCIFNTLHRYPRSGGNDTPL